MRKTIITMLFSSMVASLSAWTDAETNAVGYAIAELTALSSGCDTPVPPDDPASNEPLDEPYPSFASLFSEDLQIAPNWTPDDKRAAFFHYLNSIPDMTADGVFTGNVWYAESALGFCRIKGCAQALPYAIGVLVATNMPSSLEWEASLIFDRFALPSMSMNGFVDMMTVNTNCLRGVHTKANVYSDYCKKLAQAYDAGQTNVALSGASVLYRNICDHRGARPLDVLLLRVFPGYAASSNRLRVAKLALESDPSEEWTSGYFSNITNLLTNTAQPLPTVDGL